MAVELRWVVPEGTTTESPRLQYRNWGEWPAGAGPWVDVPTVVEQAAKKWVCPRCGVDRFKEPCPSSVILDCPMVAKAQGAPGVAGAEQTRKGEQKP